MEGSVSGMQGPDLSRMKTLSEAIEALAISRDPAEQHLGAALAGYMNSPDESWIAQLPALSSDRCPENLVKP